jgi:RNA polymerase sigma-70 factor (ECF subfamily)
MEPRSTLPDPERNYMKATFGRELKQALESALLALPPRDRTVLALHYIEGMSSSAIGKMYRVSGAAVRLWIKRSRESALVETRTRLSAQLAVNGTELESLMGLVDGDLELSISRCLKPAT